MNDIRGSIYSREQPRCDICCNREDAVIIEMTDPPRDIRCLVCQTCAKIIHALYHNWKEGRL